MVKTRLTRAATLIAAGSLVLLGATACGDDDDNKGSDGNGSDASGKVGVILPDATTSPRWEGNDRPSLQAAFDAAGVEADIQNAGGDTAKFGTICDSMINEGVKVLMIVNLDSASGAACLKKATAAGIVSIDYDRLTLNGGASYYVSFDHVVVGKLMGEGLIKCLDDAGKSSANIIYINGKATDNNAALFKQGYEEGLKAKIDAGEYKLVGDVSGEWDANKAATAFDGLYTKNDGKIDGIVSANDTMAGGIVARLKNNGLDGKVPVTGQDASIEGLQRVLAGTQCMTVYKNTNLEAELASKLAIAIIKGDQEEADALANQTVPDTEAGVDVKSALATPEAIYKDGVKKVIDDGFQKASDVCVGATAALCTEAGIS
jgi:D-xylose transport system substrate-binding protein